MHVLLIQIQLIDGRTLALAATTHTVLSEVHAFTEARAALLTGTVLGAVSLAFYGHV